MLEQMTGRVVAAIIDVFGVDAQARPSVVVGDQCVRGTVVNLIEHVP
jgi:hypothetical protein